MNEIDIRAKGIVQKYIHGTLNEEDTEAFEVYLLEHPELAEELELDILFKEHGELIPEASMRDKKAPRNWFNNKWGLAFSFGLCFLVGALVGNQTKQNHSVLSTDSKVFYVAPMRSAGNVLPPIVIDRKSTQAVFILQLPISNEAEYQIELAGPNSNSILIADNVKQDLAGDIVLNVNMQGLTAEQYSITVKNSLSGETALVQPISLDSSK